MYRELDQRRADQMTVTLEWDPATGHVQVRCEADRLPDEGFSYPVDPREATLAFNHPLAMRPATTDRDWPEDSDDRPPLGARGRRRRWLRSRGEPSTDRSPADYNWAWWLN